MNSDSSDPMDNDCELRPSEVVYSDQEGWMQLIVVLLIIFTGVMVVFCTASGEGATTDGEDSHWTQPNLSR